VASLSASDAERLLRFVAELESIGGDQPFPPELLLELGQLVETDWITYCELDRVRRRVLLNDVRPDDGHEPDEQVYWEVVVEDHPVCVAHQRGDVRALKVSDFLPHAQLRGTRLYDLWFRPEGIEHELNLPIPSPMWHTKTFLFDRSDSGDFTERDREILDLLQPALARRWRTARSERLLRAALAVLDRADEHDPRGVVLLGAGGEVEYGSPAAQRLLHEFFPGALSTLPAAVADWLESPQEAFVCLRDARRLTIVRADDALLLEEKRPEIVLTAREREVLSWVAHGKTNAEVAELLWLAPSTVRTHLEHVYAKLGVNTRTAAVARFFGLIDAEAS
jgi:DNA-binding CsgD family transcriptional regulator